MNKQLQGLNTEFASIRVALSKLEGEVADMDKSIIQQREEKKHAVESLRECKSRLERERDHRAKEKSAMSRKLHDRNVELVSIRKAHQKLEAQRVEAENVIMHGVEEKNKLPKKVRRLEDLLKSERGQRAKENRTLGQQLHDRNLELASIHDACTKLEKQLAAAEKSVKQEHAEKKQAMNSLRKFKILLKAEQDQRAEAEACKARCETLLEQQTAHRLLGSGMNIQGACEILPEIEASIRQTLTITVSEWVEEGSHTLYEFSKNREWFIPELLAILFILCKQQIDGIRQTYMNMFLGKVEGATEDEMDATTAHFMRDHLRRHHLTLFSVTGGAGERACRCIMTHIGGMIVDFWGGRVDHDNVTCALVSSGLEGIASRYLRILASCAVQHPPVSQTSDYSNVRPFNKQLHSAPIDGDGDVTRGGECMIIFPALIVKREGSGQAWEIVNKRFVLGPQKQA